MIFKRLFVFALLTALLSGCLAPVHTTTTTFYAPEHALRGIIYVVASDSKVNSSLEYAHYKSRFEQKLKANGYSIAQSSSDAQFIALVSYGIDTGKASVVSTPIFGQTGGGSTYSSGNVYGSGGSASYSGSSYTMPTYGVVGSSVNTVTSYTRAIAMDIVDADSLKTDAPHKVYEIRAKSTGTCSVIVEVFDEILEAMFRDFPGESGKSRTVSVDAEANC